MASKEKPQSEELDFLNLVLLLAGTANIELGFEGKSGYRKDKDLPRARQLINMLAALEKRTHGRLNAE